MRIRILLFSSVTFKMSSKIHKKVLKSHKIVGINVFYYGSGFGSATLRWVTFIFLVCKGVFISKKINNGICLSRSVSAGDCFIMRPRIRPPGNSDTCLNVSFGSLVFLFQWPCYKTVLLGTGKYKFPYMERLDQCSLHPSIKSILRQTCLGRDSIPVRLHRGMGGWHSTKELSRQLVALQDDSSSKISVSTLLSIRI
jgi:hypothetical protein